MNKLEMKAAPKKPRSKPKAKADTDDMPVPMIDKRYRAEDALRTLTRAEEIRKDKGLMREVGKIAEEAVRIAKSK